MKIVKILVFLAITISLYGFTTKIEAEPPTIAVKTPTSPVELIKLYADKYDAPVHELLAVSRCESNFDPHSTGDHGKANGIFQFHKDTFVRMSKWMGEDLDYNSTHDQAKLASWVFANRPTAKAEWTCSYITKIIKHKNVTQQQSTSSA